MDRNDLSHAVNQAHHHRAQADFHNAKAAKWEQLIDLWQELIGDEAASSTVEAPNIRKRERPASPPQKGAIADTRAATVLVLEESGGICPPQFVIKKLGEMGIEVGGKNPSSTLSARLSGFELVESIRGQGYRLKKSPQGDEAVGSTLNNVPTASVLTPNSADEDGREVGHDNMNHQ